jgi:superfamily II DNA helicase RecQ
MLADILQCLLYTSKSRSKEEKAAILSKWLSSKDKLVIAATSALSIGFNYPYVQWVIYIDAPKKATTFS